MPNRYQKWQQSYIFAVALWVYKQCETCTPCEGYVRSVPKVGGPISCHFYHLGHSLSENTPPPKTRPLRRGGREPKFTATSVPAAAFVRPASQMAVEVWIAAARVSVSMLSTTVFNIYGIIR